MTIFIFITILLSIVLLVNGDCPPMSTYVGCPFVCVSRIDECPNTIQPICEANTFYCPHQGCLPGSTWEDACQTINPCHCNRGDQPGNNQVPCKPKSVNITLLPSLSFDDLREARNRQCAMDLNIQDMSLFLTCDMSWPTTAPFATVFTAAAPHLIVVAILGLLTLLFLIYKKTREHKLEKEEYEVEYEEYGKDYKQQGFELGVPGMILLWLYRLAGIYTACLLVALAILGYPFGISSSNLSSSNVLNIVQTSSTWSMLFLVLWHLLLAFRIASWFFPIDWSYFFYVKVPLDKATHVLVSPIQSDSIFLHIPNIATRIWDYIWDSIYSKTTHFYKINKLQKSFQNEFSIKYHFSFDSRRYTPFDSSFSTSLVNFHVLANVDHTNLHPSFKDRIQIQNQSPKTTPHSYLWYLRKVIESHFNICFFALLILTARIHFHDIAAAILLFLLVFFGLVALAYTQFSHARALQRQINVSRCHCKVKRDSEWVMIDSQQVIPGDVLAIEPYLKILPFDVALLQGAVQVNQAHLSGSSHPCLKTSLPVLEQPYLVEEHFSHTIFAGSALLDCYPIPKGKQNPTASFCSSYIANDPLRYSPNYPIAVVTATGASTEQAKMILQTIDNNIPSSKLSDTSSYRLDVLNVVTFVMLVGGLLGLLSFIWTNQTTTSWYHVINILSRLFSPYLFLIPSLSYARALMTLLRQRVIFSDNGSTLSSAGRVEVMCFDKTGTITNDDMIYSHSLEVAMNPDSGIPSFFVPENDPRGLNSFGSSLMEAFAVTHELTPSDFTSDMLGNTMERELFQACKWTCLNTLPYPTFCHPFFSTKLQVIRQFPFDPILRRMTVITRDPDTNTFASFTKGAPSHVAQWCTRDNIPFDFPDQLQHFTQQGFYTLAFSKKSLYSYTGKEILTLPREEFERGHTFCGLAFFYNEVKDDAKTTCDQLSKTGIHQVILSGDDTMSCIYAAQEVGILKDVDSCTLLLGCIDPSDHHKVIFQDIKENRFYDIMELQGYFNNLHDAKSTYDSSLPANRDAIELAVEGDTFDFLLFTSFFTTHYERFRVFSRMTPIQKEQFILFLRERHVVGMCGNGPNDMSAIQAAHIGLLLGSSRDLSAQIASLSTPAVIEAETTVKSTLSIIFQGQQYLSRSRGGIEWILSLGVLSSLTLCVAHSMLVYPSWVIWVWMDTLSVVILVWWLFIHVPSPTGASSNSFDCSLLLQPSLPKFHFHGRFISHHVLIRVVVCAFVFVLWLGIMLAWINSQSFFTCHPFQTQFLDWSPAPFLSLPLSELTAAMSDNTRFLMELNGGNGRIPWSLSSNYEAMLLGGLLWVYFLFLASLSHLKMNRQKGTISEPMGLQQSKPSSLISTLMSLLPKVISIIKNKKGASLSLSTLFNLARQHFILFATLLLFILTLIAMSPPGIPTAPEIGSFLANSSSSLSCDLLGWYCQNNVSGDSSGLSSSNQTVTSSVLAMLPSSLQSGFIGMAISAGLSQWVALSYHQQWFQWVMYFLKMIVKR